MTNFVVFLATFCQRFSWLVVALAVFSTIGFSSYIANNIAINTDIDQLMAKDLPWRIQESEISEAFPQNTDRLVIVVDSANPDMAEYAATLLTDKLEDNTDLFKRITRPDKHEHFQKNGLLFMDNDKLSSMLDMMIKAQPMLGSLAADPSLRGLFETMDLALMGVSQGQAAYKDLAKPFGLMAKTGRDILAGKATTLPWQQLFGNDKPSLRETRKFIITQPEMDFKSLSPGAKASTFIRDTAKEHNLTKENGVTVRLTGPVALNDEEFASVAQGAGIATSVSLILVMLLLFLALRSIRLIVPILTTLIIGLITTTAFALVTIGSLNLISVAFAVMFVGVAVDFGIQFGVRYREMLHEITDRSVALKQTAQIIAKPLCLAASATALGLMAFIPTDYRGVAELGWIAGAGMIIAFILNITLLPALITIFRPPPESSTIGYAWMRPVDSFLVRFRKILMPVFVLITITGLFYASQIRFDFDPLNLKDPNSESVQTLFNIMEDPDATIYTIQILAPSLKEAQKLAKQIDQLPQVDHTMTLASFIPKDQNDKLELIDDAKFMLDPSLHPLEVKNKPTDQEIYTTLRKASNSLKLLSKDKTEAHELASVLDTIIAKNDNVLLKQLDNAMITGITNHLEQLRMMLSGDEADLNSINDELRRDWITQDGRAKIEVYPKGNPRNHEVLAAFTQAVREIVPHASGAPISIQESGKTVMNAFIQAGMFALVAIFILLILVLKRINDVFCVLAPLILSGILTLGTMVILNLPLNFANVIALPLLLSLGVSYAIYFVTYWRSGKNYPLSSGMARAVLFSAATTLVAFFSLSLSSHIGTCSMGQLLTISLLYCLLCSFLLLPVLLDPSRMR